MKKNILIIFLIVNSISVISQNSLSGNISDLTTGRPLPNASVYFADLMIGTVSDPSGAFTFPQLPEGVFLMEVKYLGFRSWVGKVEIKGACRKDISMTPAAAEIREVIITGTSASVERRLNPVPSMVISNDDLRLTNSTNLIDAISRRPGISQVTTGSGISKPVIRGLGYNRVVVLHEGIRQEDQQWGDEHGIEIDEYSVQRVEIIKGPGSMMYGSDAMAGVINFLNPKPLMDGTLALNISTEYQTNNRLGGLSIYQSGAIKGWNWLFRMSGKMAGNYQNQADGYVYNSGFKELNSSGMIGLNKKWGYTQLQYSLFNQSVGLIEGERDEEGRFIKPVVLNDTVIDETVVSGKELKKYSIEVPWQKLRHTGIISNTSIILGKSRLAVKAGFQQNQRSELAEVTAPDEASLFLKLNTLTYDVKFFFPENHGWETSAGIGGMLQYNTNGGIEYLIPDYSLADIGVFVFTRKSLGKILLSGGLRADRRSIYSRPLFTEEEGQKFDEFRRNFSSFSGSIGGSYNLNESWVMKLNVSKGFRAPNIAELASNGRHEGTYRYESGNKDLKPENSLQLDAGFIYSSMHVSIETDLFLNQIDQYIFLRKLRSEAGGDSIMDLDDPAPVFRFEQGNALLYGGEFTIDIHPHPFDWIHFENSLAYVRGIRPGNPDSLYNLPMIPPLRLRSQLRIDIPGMRGQISGTYVLVGADYSMKQDNVYSAYSTESETPSWFTMYAGLGFDFSGKNENKIFSLQLSVNNLFDINYQDHLSRLKYAPENPVTGHSGIYNMGRNIGVKLVFPMQWEIKKAADVK
jgi:iron complex outermembrane receptor protein